MTRGWAARWLFLLPVLAGVVWFWPSRKSTGWIVRVHPTGGLFVGDVVSWEVRPPPGQVQRGEPVVLRLQRGGLTLEWRATFQPFGFARELAAVVPLAWDTRVGPAEPGTYILTVIYHDTPQGQWPVHLAPAEQRPWWEQGVHWRTRDLPCCQVVTLTRTPASRDAFLLEPLLQTTWARLTQRLGQPDERPTVVWVPRLLGQGGFALRANLWLSYLDQDPTGSDPAVLLHHELTHWFDHALHPATRPSMLVEGWAVYLSHGHYHREPLLDRAAALLPLGLYIPLPRLVEGFYTHQHEVAYLEAGALFSYMVDRWGWDAVHRFYVQFPQGTSTTALHDQHRASKDALVLTGGPVDGLRRDTPAASDWGPLVVVAQARTEGERLDVALQQAFGVDLATLDQDFRAALRARAQEARLWIADVDLTVRHFETLRRYQQVLDPSAHYTQAWLLPLDLLQERDVIADVYRQPGDVTSVVARLLLQEAARRRNLGDYRGAQAALQAVTQVLDAVEAGHPRAWLAHPMARRVAWWVEKAHACGWAPQRLMLDDAQVVMWVWRPATYPWLEAVPRGALAACRPIQGVDLATRAALWRWPAYPQGVVLDRWSRP
ncbi:MAG: hypothetical protein GXO54_05945 [Chloroflexi bacterium]|nr:hypothetical protein [Chloroflexota bacterium]